MERRKFVQLILGGLSLAVLSPLLTAGKAFAATAIAKLNKTNDEWKNLLTPAQYTVLREQGTERPFTSPLLEEHREGMFACVACDLPLFLSTTKFDSGTGWPSFFDTIPDHLETKADHALLMARTEYHCAQCGGHHGHVFNDGPKPTGLRYCSNGVALKFIPKKA